MRTKFRSLASLLVLSAVGAALVAGCGGGGSSSSSSSSSSTDGEGGSFVLGAEAACTSADKQITALGTPQQEQVLGYLETTETVIEELHEEIEALGGGSEADAAYTEALGKAVIVLNHMTNAARSENFDAVRELSDELIALKVGKLAEAAELKACAEVPGASA
jgi:hypothetical protein